MCTIDFPIGIVAFSFQGVVAAGSVPRRRRAWPLPAAAGVPVAGAAGSPCPHRSTRPCRQLNT